MAERRSVALVKCNREVMFDNSDLDRFVSIHSELSLR